MYSYLIMVWGLTYQILGKQFLWSRHFEGILSILSRIPLDSLPTLTWPTQTIHISIRHERRKRQSASEKGQISTRYTSCICQLGDSLVFIFPLATMLMFTSAVGKLNVRVLWHHHMLLQVISQSYRQVFVKSYNFVFEQIDKEGSPREK